MIRRVRRYVERNPFTCASVTMLAGLGLAMASRGEAYQSPQQPQGPLPEFAVGHAPAPLAQPVFGGPQRVDLSYLKRPKVGGLFGAYIGVRGQLPDVAEIDFAANLEYLWERKLAIKGVSPATRKSAAAMVTRYRASYPDTKGIREYVSGVHRQSSLKSLDWSALCAKMRVAAPQCGALRVVSGRLGGRELTAYGMTELFPGFNGKFNYVLLDTLLRNAGENYLSEIPALGDTLMSKGPYQFTSHAVYAADSRQGASYVDQFVADRRAGIPGSVAALTGGAHHRAAKMFAVYNLGRLAQRLSPSEAATLSSGACSTEQLTQFVATAHHMPTLAIKRAADWVGAGCRKPLTAYLGPHLREYAAKTSANYAALGRAI